MSEYINLNIHANRTEPVLANFTATTAGQPIMKVPSFYSVGVNRFKIPLSSIPLYRIYQDYFAMTPMCLGSNNLEASSADDNGPLEFAYQSFLDLQMVNTNYGRYGLDNSNGSKKFIDMRTQNDFLKLMNHSLVRGMNKIAIDKGASQQIVSGALTIGSGTNLGNGLDGLTQLGSTLTVAEEAADASYPGLRGQILCGFTLRVTELTGNAGANNFAGTTADFSKLTFILRREAIDATRASNGDVNEWVLSQGILKGTTSLSLTANPRSPVDITTGIFGHLEAQEMADSTLYNAHKSSTSVNEFFLFPTATDMTGVVGKRYDGYTYKLFAYNEYTPTAQADSPTYTVPNAGISLTLNYMNRDFIPSTLVPASSLTNPQSDLLMPRFTIEDDGRFAFNCNTLYSLFFGYRIFMNNVLSNMFSFEDYRIVDLGNKSLLENYFTAVQNSSLNHGGIYGFESAIERPTNIGGRVEFGSIVSYLEDFKTNFKRDFLNSLVITTGRLAVDGEYSGGGNTKRRVLTDFEIDPSTVGRDYLVFTNSGGMRLYSLNNPQEIQIVDAQVRFQDIYGVLRQLVVLPSEECSIKLEFRPNTQIYALTEPFSSLD